MLEKIEVAFRDLLASLQVAKLYETRHPMFNKSVDKAYQSLQSALAEREELVIGIVGEELAFEKEIFFDLSKLLKPTILYLKDRGMERIAFHRGLQREELSKFIEFLVAPKEEIKKDFQEHLSFAGIKNISAGKLQVSSGAKAQGNQQSMLSASVYESSVAEASRSLESILNTEAIDHLAFRFAINNVLENLITQHRDFLKLITLRRYDLGTFAHLLNVSTLSMYFASKIGFSKDIVLDMGVAGLLHDIGKLYISRKVITKKDKLTDKEFAQMESHTVLGAELLLHYTDTLGILPVVVALEHHLRYNLSGYPKLAFPRKLHISSLIVCICDVYDALSERRGYKTDYPPDMIYNMMLKEKGTTFDPVLVDKFFAIVGIWPIGSIVALNDARVAIVIGENEDDVTSPKVRVIHPEDNKEAIDLKYTKDKINIERFLNPWKEGQEYLHLIESIL
jgi:putative nucleotidyltransferase with HDIG domain